ncbi:MAG: hypothetical protein ACRYG7_54900 [Janthinobacterium lividum]
MKSTPLPKPSFLAQWLVRLAAFVRPTPPARGSDAAPGLFI